MKNNELPSFCSIRQAAATHILPEFRLRRMCAEGQLPGFYAGKKFMINFSALCAQLDKIGRAGDQA